MIGRARKITRAKAGQIVVAANPSRRMVVKAGILMEVTLAKENPREIQWREIKALIMKTINGLV